LVADGALRLTLERSLYRLAERWIPQGLSEPGDAPARAMISVRASPVPLRRPTERHTLVLGGVAVWVDQERAAARLCGAAPAGGQVHYVCDARVGWVGLSVGRSGRAHGP